jgi:hypothetical protein
VGVVGRPLKKLRSSSGSRKIEDFRSNGPPRHTSLSLYIYIMFLSLRKNDTQKEKNENFLEREKERSEIRNL